MSLVWQTAGGDKVCKVCAGLDGEIDGGGKWDSLLPAGPNEIFGLTVYGPPPVHPNCRCTTIEVRDELGDFVSAVADNEKP